MHVHKKNQNIFLKKNSKRMRNIIVRTYKLARNVDLDILNTLRKNSSSCKFINDELKYQATRYLSITLPSSKLHRLRTKKEGKGKNS